MVRSTPFVTVGAVLALVAGYATADAYDVVPGVLTLDRDAPTASAAPSATVSAGATPVAVPTPAASAVALPGLSSAAPAPAPAALATALAGPVADPALGPSVGVSVRDALTGAVLYDHQGAVPRTPASTMKVLTAAAVIDPLGPQTRFATRVVQGAVPGQVVLVAGGDMLLGAGESNPAAVQGRAGLATLARQTAAALRARGVSKVTVAVDLTYAAGPDFAPTWDRRDLDPGYVGKVTMLGLATELAWHGRPAQPDPAGSAARAFAAALARTGIAVTGAPTPGRAPAGAAELGRVESAPAADVLAVALDLSDNALTESLARQGAVRSGVRLGPAAFAQVAAWVRGRLTTLGYDLTGFHGIDACGLSRGQQVPARLVTDALVRGASGKDPALAAVLTELPVAGLTGTLADRFDTPGAAGAAGLARAKTGTLTGVSALAGTVVDRSGRLLAFDVVADQVPPLGTDSARMALDRVVSVLAGR